jgi:hypothetical protein
MEADALSGNIMVLAAFIDGVVLVKRKSTDNKTMANGLEIN